MVDMSIKWMLLLWVCYEKNCFIFFNLKKKKEWSFFGCVRHQWLHESFVVVPPFFAAVELISVLENEKNNIIAISADNLPAFGTARRIDSSRKFYEYL